MLSSNAYHNAVRPPREHSPRLSNRRELPARDGRRTREPSPRRDIHGFPARASSPVPRQAISDDTVSLAHRVNQVMCAGRSPPPMAPQMTGPGQPKTVAERRLFRDVSSPILSGSPGMPARDLSPVPPTRRVSGEVPFSQQRRPTRRRSNSPTGGLGPPSRFVSVGQDAGSILTPHMGSACSPSGPCLPRFLRGGTVKPPIAVGGSMVTGRHDTAQWQQADACFSTWPPRQPVQWPDGSVSMSAGAGRGSGHMSYGARSPRMPNHMSQFSKRPPQPTGQCSPRASMGVSCPPGFMDGALRCQSLPGQPWHNQSFGSPIGSSSLHSFPSRHSHSSDHSYAGAGISVGSSLHGYPARPPPYPMDQASAVSDVENKLRHWLSTFGSDRSWDDDQILSIAQFAERSSLEDLPADDIYRQYVLYQVDLADEMCNS